MLILVPCSDFLEEHVDAYRSDGEILARCRQAHVLAVADITVGTAEIAPAGVAAPGSEGRCVTNDGNPALFATGPCGTVGRFDHGAAGALLGIRPSRPADAYVRLADITLITGCAG